MDPIGSRPLTDLFWQPSEKLAIPQSRDLHEIITGTLLDRFSFPNIRYILPAMNGPGSIYEIFLPCGSGRKPDVWPITLHILTKMS